MGARKGFGKGLLEGIRKNRWFGGSSAALSPSHGTHQQPAHAQTVANLGTISNSVPNAQPTGSRHVQKRK